MGKKLRNTIIISVSSLIVMFAGFLIFYPVPDPPVIKMKTARDSLSVAAKNQADRYSPELYRQAGTCYDSAMTIWRRENEKFIYTRNYDMVEDYARLSAKMANFASESTLGMMSELRQKLSPDIDTLNSLLKKINDKYSNYPYPPEIRERISRGKMLLKDAETAFKSKLFLEAESYLAESENLLLSSWEFADLNLRNYFTSYPTWKKWIDKTIAASKTNGEYSIIIDKFSRKLVVYNQGKKIKEFSAELGKNWVGNKRVKGDKATPEGMYKIIKKLEGRNTKYHKALLLNYPNDEDSARFRRDVSNGALPASANIGGMIEIHGDGGKGVDWTEGCIALKDNEMDSIFRYAVIGTPVTIVGSMQDIDKILEK
jgi:hypothetical protein